MISRGVEISIAGGGGEMVRGLSLGLFSFFLSFFVIMRSLFFQVQKASCSASYGENKTYKSKHITKESHATSKYPLSRRFLLHRAIGHI